MLVAGLFSENHTAPVAQLDRASVFGTEGWGFESLRVYSTYDDSNLQWHGILPRVE